MGGTSHRAVLKTWGGKFGGGLEWLRHKHVASRAVFELASAEPKEFMKLNIVLPWICALGLGAGLAAVFVSGQEKDAELAKLRPQAAKMDDLQAQLDSSEAKVQSQVAQIAELRKDNQELLRLRGEVGSLRADKAKLASQLQSAQNQTQNLQAQTEDALKSNRAEINRLQAALLQPKPAAPANPQRDACINNLRQLDAAKQQWALEFHRTADSVPAAQDIAPYLPGNVLPVCPAGGAYVLNAVNHVPTCSIPGHALQ